MKFLEQLQWRRAIKVFDTTKPVEQNLLDKILFAIQMAPTSYGLQPFYVKVITDDSLKQKLKAAGFNQAQFATASHVLVFVALTNMQNRINEYAELASSGKPEVKQKLEPYFNMIRGSLQTKEPTVLKSWAQKQIYIALGFAMAACAELKVDSCPMEGFVPEEFDKILQLPQGEYSTVALTIGYRDPKVALNPQKRFSKQEMFHF